MKDKNDQDLLTEITKLREKEKVIVADLLKYLSEY